MGRISRKTTDFFEMFVKSATIAKGGAEQLRKAFSDGKIDIDEMRKIKEFEHEGDQHFHECMRVIEAAFITPIDRPDLVGLLNSIETVTDSLDYISTGFYMMCVENSTPGFEKLVELVVESVDRVLDLTVAFKNYKKNTKEINDLVIDINRIEEEGDKVYYNNVRELFEKENDAKMILQHKTLYDLLEDSLDRCEDVADSIANIIIMGS